jgi:hypothetical protein
VARLLIDGVLRLGRDVVLVRTTRAGRDQLLEGTPCAALFDAGSLGVVVGFARDEQNMICYWTVMANATSRGISSAYRYLHTRRQHRAALTAGMYPGKLARRAAQSPSSPDFDPAAASHVMPARWLLIAAALVALIGAGCSNSPGETDSSGTSNATSDGAGGAGGDEGGAEGGGGAQPSPAEMQAIQAKLPEFARCMRENGVADFPDPGPEGGIAYNGDPDPAVFKSANEKCRPILPSGGKR